MSKYTTVYNRILTVVPTYTGFTDRTKLGDPITLESNSIQFLRNGWGIIAGDDSEAELQVYKENRVAYGFTFRITQEVLKTDHNSTAIDTVTLSLKEDAITLKENLIADEQLSIETSIEKVDHTGTSGISKVILDTTEILYIDVSFSIEISEDR